jgi:hypothetical protein
VEPQAGRGVGAGNVTGPLRVENEPKPVRDDLADEARSAADIWTADAIEVNCERSRLTRVEELIARYSLSEPIVSRMAGSVRTRSISKSESKTG